MDDTNENEGTGVEGVKEHLCFEDGVVEAVDRVQRLLLDQDVVVVGIDGSGADVGKSTLLAELSHRVDALRIAVATCSEINGIPDVFTQIDAKKTLYHNNKCVIIVEHTGLATYLNQKSEKMMKAHRNAAIAETLKSLGIDKTEIDLYVSIYAKGKPFARSESPEFKALGDVVICNEKATDKPRMTPY